MKDIKPLLITSAYGHLLRSTIGSVSRSEREINERGTKKRPSIRRYGYTCSRYSCVPHNRSSIGPPTGYCNNLLLFMVKCQPCSVVSHSRIRGPRCIIVNNDSSRTSVEIIFDFSPLYPLWYFCLSPLAPVREYSRERNRNGSRARLSRKFAGCLCDAFCLDDGTSRKQFSSGPNEKSRPT